MKISDLIKMGLRNLSRRKARTALTVVGVVIGTISIVVMISIGIGMNTGFKSQVMELGSLSTITISKYAAIKDDKGNYIDTKEQIINEDLLNTVKQIEHVKTASPVLNAQLTLKIGNSVEGYAYCSVMDVDAMKEFGMPDVQYGEMPTEENPDVLIMGSEVPKNYFYSTKGNRYEPYQFEAGKDKILAYMEMYQYELKDPAKRAEFYLGTNIAILQQNSQYDYQCFMSLDTFKKWYMEAIDYIKPSDKKKAIKALKEYETIQLNVDNVKNVSKVEKKIKEMGYQTESLNSYLAPLEQTSNMMQMVLGGVGAVAMLVSAISIANTMIMSIYERTKEIGVMKVLGCCITDIKKLFLFEAGMIGLIGGIIGIILSYIASFCINKYGGPLFEALMKSTSVMYDNSVTTSFSIIPIWLPFLAAGFAIAVGVISGYYPAKRATKISAIEAMKTEG
ncbi:ABC-type transport system, involved in lipoprotein release, permease component [Anaerosporobacter mobilis DSM 15930]|jgi:ABC-type antimicrobial peptide transport system permease subunit|uniref:ABC-type transport system, involved in lipoprotein release, permease component n=1 Tax=Anaerosporobacter mobilis DSM 15930 TaxID=1120996 RepID=A0A1M7K2P8_9FIRM|nr:ABC transporter permease [Anaerosporobacter mobilis]SHM59097.1 ABC-type transport system, involved in lipoprotein release, permease component [Anaerosporobacter mobilis DSM 15930]